MALTRFEIVSRVPYAGGRRFGSVGAYEQADGVAHFAVDPKHLANSPIVDLGVAPRNAAGFVEFEADFSVVIPVEPNCGNGRAIVELPNRGRRRLVAMLNCAPHDAPVAREAHPGDGFLFERGFTVASIGWQWDVYSSDALMGLRAPVAMQDGAAVSGETMVEIRPNQRQSTWQLADRTHQPLPAAPGGQRQAILYVRDYEDGEDEIVPRARWRFVTTTSGSTCGVSRSWHHIPTTRCSAPTSPQATRLPYASVRCAFTPTGSRRSRQHGSTPCKPRPESESPCCWSTGTVNTLPQRITPTSPARATARR